MQSPNTNTDYEASGLTSGTDGSAAIPSTLMKYIAMERLSLFSSSLTILSFDARVLLPSRTLLGLYELSGIDSTPHTCSSREEFVPYVFQLLSVMLEQYPMSDTVTAVCKSQSMVNGSQSGSQGQSRTRPSPPYSALLPRLLIPTLWDQRGNVPALARLMQSYVLHDIEEVLSSNKLSAMLGVYQRLI
ncbi:hypothetical protein CRM22_007966 [Opisthorchis felineus]|uniref:Exportin-2 C-terminal domain-containing protein n=1 Tax=Opisthorchis felineus TaxID=147828 RepID=A0A4S2LLP0_OPIFE|nr:hypothetical protein CRM22_007966 [Opisthorchis felineus]